jgi:broad specificity phosphatase PhoE
MDEDMAKLYLVRHAQASFGFENYDQLSDLGIKQSAYIPKHFEAHPGHGIHAFYRGDMLRHKQTVENSFTGIEPIVDRGFNEFDHEDVFKVYRPEIADKEKTLELVMSQKDPKKFLEDEFEKAMLAWMNEEGTSSYRESFKIFKERSLQALQQVMSKARSEKHKEVLAVTSGGFISLAVVHILGIPCSKMIDLNLNIANTSVTAFLFNDKKMSLSYYNNYNHLPKDMVTFR